MDLHTAWFALQPSAPFDFEKALEHLGSTSPFQRDVSIGPGCLTRAIMVEGLPMVARVTSTGTPDAPGLRCVLWAGVAINSSLSATAARQIRTFLGIEDDVAGFYSIAENDEAMAPLVRQFYGYHQLRFPTPFEAACWAVLTQHNHWSIARKMKETLTRELGPTLVVEGLEYRAFPGPAQLLTAGPQAVGWLIKNERRTASLLAAAAAFADIDTVFLAEAPQADVERWLRSISGIGPWSANFVLIRGLGRMEVTPLIDQSLMRAAYEVYGPDRIRRTEDVVSIAARYGRFQGYWVHCLRLRSWIERHERRRRVAVPEPGVSSDR